jgi:hypothetical protein
MSMGFLSGKHLPRRTFVRGMGATMALPFLDAMVPAGRHWGQVLSETRADQTALIAMEEVHGLAGCNAWGRTQYLYSPATVGRDFEIVPENPLKALEPWRNTMTIISDTDCRMAEPFSLPEIGGDHFRSSSVFLTQSHPKQTQGSDLFSGISLDQIYAKRFGQDTPMPSMQFSIETVDQAGGCTYNYACAYMDAISWASPTEPLPMVRDPRIAFDMLFGAGGTPEERTARLASRRSILDWILGEVNSLQRQLGAADRQRMERYVENVREIERRIQAVEARNTSGEAREMPEAPAGVPDSYSEHIRILFDLQVLALESDMTRVISFKLGRDAQNRAFPEAEFTGAFHPTSHYGNNQQNILNFNKINKYRLGQVAYLMQRLQETPTAEGTLLDKTLVLWGSPMSDANLHNHRRCPLVLLGGASGRFDGNLHIMAAEGTPMANAMLSVLHNLGVDDLESFGDSTGTLPLTAPRSATATTTSSS